MHLALAVKAVHLGQVLLALGLVLHAMLWMAGRPGAQACTEPSRATEHAVALASRHSALHLARLTHLREQLMPQELTSSLRNFDILRALLPYILPRTPTMGTIPACACVAKAHKSTGAHHHQHPSVFASVSYTSHRPNHGHRLARAQLVHTRVLLSIIEEKNGWQKQDKNALARCSVSRHPPHGQPHAPRMLHTHSVRIPIASAPAAVGGNRRTYKVCSTDRERRG